jgi:hypothetical protein
MIDIEREVRDEGNCVRVTGGGKEAWGCVRTALPASGIELVNVSRRRPKQLDRELMIQWFQQREAAKEILKRTQFT